MAGVATRHANTQSGDGGQFLLALPLQRRRRCLGRSSVRPHSPQSNDISGATHEDAGASRHACRRRAAARVKATPPDSRRRMRRGFGRVNQLSFPSAAWECVPRSAASHRTQFPVLNSFPLIRFAKRRLGTTRGGYANFRSPASPCKARMQRAHKSGCDESSPTFSSRCQQRAHFGKSKGRASAVHSPSPNSARARETINT